MHPLGRLGSTQRSVQTRRLGGAFDKLGLSSDALVGTFAWSTARHLALYWAAPYSG
jgi:fatty-acyl-CoA synthase